MQAASNLFLNVVKLTLIVKKEFTKLLAVFSAAAEVFVSTQARISVIIGCILITFSRIY